LTLGEKFVPGSDTNHFCKPTSVATDDEENIYVADGYCNSRVMKFDKYGNFIMQWGKSYNVYSFLPPADYEFSVVHSIKYIPQDGTVCAADRENGRVQCFNSNSGKLTRIYKDHEKIGSNIYALDYVYDGKDGMMYFVNNKGESSHGTTINYRTGEVVATWPYNFLSKAYRSTFACCYY